MNLTVEQLPAVNATLNALAACLLLFGLARIKAGDERTHKLAMLSAFAVSIVFLACYLIYHYHVGSVPFEGTGAVRVVYLSILLTHVVLAATVPILASVTIYLGFKDRRLKHRRLARWTFPIWLYVSITGVVIYLMLYHWQQTGNRQPESSRLTFGSESPILLVRSESMPVTVPGQNQGRNRVEARQEVTSQEVSVHAVGAIHSQRGS